MLNSAYGGCYPADLTLSIIVEYIQSTWQRMKVVRRINRGGFGYVDEIIDDNGNHLARKTFDPQLGQMADLVSLRRRFEREVRVQSAIKHPNIMPVVDSKLDEDPPWFLMPLASQSLEQKIIGDHQQGVFDQTPWPDVLAAIEELHRLGYVHRDLKPANVLNVSGNWVVSDFGLILPMARDTTVLTRTGSAYGSQSYAAPEQAMDFKNTPEQADIFALGCMLHDAIEAQPVRIPFAQIQGSGYYGPLLEKCTEVDYKRRVPTVRALRAALFELWSSQAATSLPQVEGDALEQVKNTPDAPDAWRRLIQQIEQTDTAARDTIFRSIGSEMLQSLQAADEILFSRIVSLICDWVSSSAFEFSYCDVVGDRLVQAYQVSPIRLRCQIVLSALELAESHNRYHVMSQVGAMLGATADNGLVDRILIEVGLEPSIESKLRSIEKIIRWPRSQWHPEIAKHLTKKGDDFIF